MLDAVLKRLRIARLRAGLALVVLGSFVAGQPLPDPAPDDGDEPDPAPQPPPQAVLGERGREMLREGRRPRRRSVDVPPPPLKGSAAERLAARDARAKGG